MDLMPSTQLIKDTRDKVFRVFDEIQKMSVGFNVLMGGVEQTKWDLIKEYYYQQIKEIILYENDFLKISSPEEMVH